MAEHDFTADVWAANYTQRAYLIECHPDPEGESVLEIQLDTGDDVVAVPFDRSHVRQLRLHLQAVERKWAKEARA